MKKRFNIYSYYLLLILFLEVCYKLFVYRHLNIGLFFMLFFSITISFILYLITKLFKKRNKQYITSIIISIIIIFIYGFNFIYYKLLNVPFSISTLSLANQAIDFYSLGISALIKNIGYIVVLLAPLFLLIIGNRCMDYTRYKKSKIKLMVKILVTYIISIVILLPFKDTAYKYYFENDNMSEEIDYFGLLTSSRLNIQRTIFGFKENIVILDEPKMDEIKVEEKKEEFNTLDIDFLRLTNNTNNDDEKNLYSYFSNSISTNKNEYTGYFKDKNLIFILAEGFNSIAVSEELTPTLYKLTHTGFVFNNYYSPIFLSTTGGEFQATTGLIPTQETLNVWRKNNPNIKFALGNTFNNLGYTTNAFHDWTYTYYKRDKTMPTLGFNNYMGCNNGMEKLISCKWLPSDVEMINKTSNMYMNENKFMTYYISVSGHAPYNFTGGNSMAIKNKDMVKDLNYSTPVKAYISSQIEFDKAIESLINNLSETGKLDDTVIVITGDHYPYTLTNDEINELSSYKRDELFEVNHSNLVIWNNNNEVIKEVDKVGSQIDVLPTILNLFGIDYDSRMLIGHDILSDTEGLAIFSDHSFISDTGIYNNTTKKFIKKSEINITDDYVNNMNIRVDNSFIVSKMILETDIYKKVLGD